MAIASILRKLYMEWGTPRPALHRGGPTAFGLRCVAFARPEERVDTDGAPLPPDVEELWRRFSSARLFEDIEQGRCGLVLHGPPRAEELSGEFAAQHPADHRPGDLILGEFIGDAAQLLVRCDPQAEDFGHIWVVRPASGRADAARVATSLHAFLATYRAAEGENFWERPDSDR